MREHDQNPGPSSFLAIRDLSKEFDGHMALKSTSFHLGKGDFLSLFGPNGAGKSTLLNIIATLSRPSTGTVEARGFDLVDEPELFRKQLGVISHQSLLYNKMTARENLIFYGRLYLLKKPENKADELLKLVDLYPRRNSMAGQFSQGMRQRLSIARALVNDPSLLLLDEPYSGLDQHASAMLTKQLYKLRDRERTVIMVTHNLAQGLEVATKVGILVKGRMALFSDREDVSSHTFEKCYLEHVQKVCSR